MAQVFDYFDSSCSAARNEWDYTLVFVRPGCHNSYDTDTGLALSIDITCTHGYRVYNGTGCNTQLTPVAVYAGWVGTTPNQCMATTATDILSGCSTARASCSSTATSLATMVATTVPDLCALALQRKHPQAQAHAIRPHAPPTASVTTYHPASSPTTPPTLSPTSPSLFRPSARVLVITFAISLDQFNSSQLQQILDAVKQEVLTRASGLRARRSLSTAQVRVTSTSTTVEVEFAEGTSDSVIDALQASFTTQSFVIDVAGTQVESGATVQSSDGDGSDSSTTIIIAVVVVVVVVVVLVIVVVVGVVVYCQKTRTPNQNEDAPKGKQQEIVVTVNNAYAGFENEDTANTGTEKDNTANA